MASSAVTYTRLPGRTWLSLVGRHSIWLADDHLLSVWSRYFTEEYKRSYFQDIQALVIRETRRRGIFSAVFGLIGVLWFWAALAVNDPAAIAVFGVLALLGFGMLGLNLLWGPTCVLHVQTPVHQEKLACVSRVRTAERLIQKLRPRIEAAQGTLSRGDLQTRFAAEPRPADSSAPLPPE